MSKLAHAAGPCGLLKYLHYLEHWHMLQFLLQQYHYSGIKTIAKHAKK